MYFCLCCYQLSFGHFHLLLRLLLITFKLTSHFYVFFSPIQSPYSDWNIHQHINQIDHPLNKQFMISSCALFHRSCDFAHRSIHTILWCKGSALWSHNLLFGKIRLFNCIRFGILTYWKGVNDNFAYKIMHENAYCMLEREY